MFYFLSELLLFLKKPALLRWSWERTRLFSWGFGWLQKVPSEMWRAQAEVVPVRGRLQTFFSAWIQLTFDQCVIRKGYTLELVWPL